jgi:pimeloyl-ACP methyl ester carboxylesterase
MKIYNDMILRVLLVSSFFLIYGCSSTVQREYFEAYEEEFKSRTHYIAHNIQRDGLNIHAREYGKPSEKPTLVLMHGFPDSLHLYDWLVPELLEDRHIIAFDFIGWGESEKPTKHLYDTASLRSDFEAVINYFNLSKLVVVVHDASGQPGIDWVIDNPEKTAGLVLLNTYYSPMPTLKAPEAIELFSTPGIRRELSILATSLSDTIWLSRYKEQMAKFISTEALREDFHKVLGYQSLNIRRAFFGLNRVLIEETDKRKTKVSQLSKLNTPVLIVFGRDDPYLNIGVAEEFNKLFVNSKMFLIEGAGHFVQIDKPVHVANLLRTFPL